MMVKDGEERSKVRAGMRLTAYVQMAFDFFTVSPREAERTAQAPPDLQATPPSTPKPVTSPEPVPGSAPQPLGDPEYRHPLANRSLQWGEVRVHYWLKRSARRTIGMVVSPKGLEVSAPKWVSVAQILEALEEKRGWILRQLRAMRERSLALSAQVLPLDSPLILPLWGWAMEVVLVVPALGHPGAQRPGSPWAQCLAGAQLMRRSQGRWHDCEPLSLLSGLSADQEDLAPLPSSSSPSSPSSPLRLVLPWGEPAADKVVLIQDLSDAHKVRLAQAVQTWIATHLLACLKARVAHYAPIVGVTWSGIKLSRAASRWGSANARGVLSFSRHLAHVPMALLDYVVVHELSHFKHMDHSSAFWAVVREVMPDYEERRALLQKTALPNWQAWDALAKT